MKQTSSSAARTRSAVKRPAANPHSSAADSPHAVRIHYVAYALYEARGGGVGHDLDEGLGAEAAVAGEAAGPRPAGSDH